jgi:hypothetical protein
MAALVPAISILGAHKAVLMCWSSAPMACRDRRDKPGDDVREEFHAISFVARVERQRNPEPPPRISQVLNPGYSLGIAGTTFHAINLPRMPRRRSFSL